MKLTKSIRRMIIAGGALLSMLAVVGAQPLSAKVEVPGETAKPANIVETRGRGGSVQDFGGCAGGGWTD